MQLVWRLLVVCRYRPRLHRLFPAVDGFEARSSWAVVGTRRAVRFAEWTPAKYAAKTDFAAFFARWRLAGSGCWITIAYSPFCAPQLEGFVDSLLDATCALPDLRLSGRSWSRSCLKTPQATGLAGSLRSKPKGTAWSWGALRCPARRSSPLSLLRK